MTAEPYREVAVDEDFLRVLGDAHPFRCKTTECPICGLLAVNGVTRGYAE